MRPRSMSILLAAAATTGLALAAVAPARAGVVDVWTGYSSIGACKTALLGLNSYCYGLAGGTALGLVDASFAVDELDQALGIRYDDENVLPAPEGPGDAVVEVWNNTGDYTFLAAGTSLYGDAVHGVPVYFIAPHADDTWSGPGLDATAANLSHYGFDQGNLRIEATNEEDTASVITFARDLATRV